MLRKVYRQEHKKVCPNQIIPCIDCEEVHQRKDMDFHNLSCLGKITSCSKCDSHFQKRNQENHDCVVELKAQINQLNFQMSTMTDTMAQMMIEMKKMREENNDVKFKMGLGHYEVVF